MSGGLEITPSDELTGLPLPILVTGEDYYPRTGEERQRDFHHAFHPGNSEELGVLPGNWHPDMTLDADSSQTMSELTGEIWLPGMEVGQRVLKSLKMEGEAVRFCRGQLTPRFIHDRYHDIFYGPRLPQTREEKYGLAVMACSGIVPREAILLDSKGGYDVVDMSPRQYEFVASPTRIFHEGAYKRGYRDRRNRIGSFFADYILEQELTDLVTVNVIEEFVETQNVARKRELGNFMLANAIDASLQDLLPLHRAALKEGMTVRRRIDPRHAVRKFFTKVKFRDYYDPLTEKAAAALA